MRADSVYRDTGKTLYDAGCRSVSFGIESGSPKMLKVYNKKLDLKKLPDSCKIITFLDKSHKWTRDHFSTQVKILREEYGCEIIKLDDT